MEGLVREVWGMGRPGGKLAVTMWGPRIFEPVYSRWQAAIKQERTDLYSAFNPWDRITDPESVRRLLRGGGAANIEIGRKTAFRRCAQPKIGGSSLLDQDCGGQSIRWGRRQRRG